MSSLVEQEGVELPSIETTVEDSTAETNHNAAVDLESQSEHIDVIPPLPA